MGRRGEALLTGPTSFELKGRCPECDCEGAPPQVRRLGVVACAVGERRTRGLPVLLRQVATEPVLLFLGRLLGCESATELLAS